MVYFLLLIKKDFESYDVLVSCNLSNSNSLVKLNYFFNVQINKKRVNCAGHIPYMSSFPWS